MGEKNFWGKHWAYNDEAFPAKYDMHVGMTWQFRDYGWLHILEWCFNRRQVHNRLTILMGCWHDAHNQSKDNSQKNPREKILHNESSNTTLGHCTYSWVMIIIWISHCMERTKNALECKQGHPMTMDHEERGTYISNQVRMHAYHLTSEKKKNHLHIFLNCYRKILNEVQQDSGKRKEALWWW